MTSHKQLIEMIENFWIEADRQETENWMAHCEINMVILATSLAPDGFLTL